MLEIPLLMNGPMVRAVLDGRKTVTRRIVKPQPPARNDMVNAAYCGNPNLWLPEGNIYADTPRQWTCPYGRSGDRLWVRETWGQLGQFSCDDDPVFWRADYTDEELLDQLLPRWRPSIHMPRWASRIRLDVTGVRVERLQDISEVQCRLEGAPPGWLDADDNETVHAHAPPTFRQGFARLWRDINGASSWNDNPWVWVVEFKRIEQQRTAA